MTVLPDHILFRLLTHAQHARPHECCGAIFTHPDDATKFVIQAYTNRAAQPEHEFLIHPLEFLQSKMLYDGPPVGFYHSHPTREARISVKDCRLLDGLATCGLDLPMVIIGLQPVVEFRCYQKQGAVYRLLWLHQPAPRQMTVEDVKRVRKALHAKGSVPL